MILMWFNRVHPYIRAGTRGLSLSNIQSGPIKNVTVFGGGPMGLGIAEVAAAAGNTVNVVEINDKLMQQAQTIYAKNVARTAKGKSKKDAAAGEAYLKKVMAGVSFFTDKNKAVQDCDLVVEAIIENLKIKQGLFKELDEICPPKTILASNTSSMQVTDIFSVIKRKDKAGGLHFFNPVPMMRLLEVIKLDNGTSDETFKDMLDWGKTIGKSCVSCKDTPGFIVNRLLFIFLYESIKLVERGDASLEDVDIAMRLGCGHPIGPFALCDLIGLDVGLYIAEGWAKKFPNDPMFKVPESLRQKVKEGKLGIKSGEGWYKYKK